MFDPILPVLTTDLAPRVNLALQQNHVPFFRRLEIANPGEEPLRDVLVKVSAWPAFIEPWQQRIDVIAPGKTHVAAPVSLSLLPEFLAVQAEREVGHVEIQIEAAGVALMTTRVPVEVLAPHEWGGTALLPELLAAFVRPNASVLAAVLVDAAERLKASTGDPSLSGYQRKDPKRVFEITQAIYSAVQASGVTYCTPPASFEKQGQKVRTHEQVLTSRLATCLDLTVLFAALLEQSGLNPLLIVTDGHAFPGVWLTDFSLQTPTLDNPRPILKRVELGEALVFDSSAVAQSASFEKARQVAETNLKNEGEFVAAIDVRCARVNKILPLPLDRTENAGQEHLPHSTPAVAATSSVPSDRFRPQTGPIPCAAEPGNARIERWKAKLLDLSLRNRLLNYKTGAKTCGLPLVDCGALEDVLAADKPLVLEPKLAVRALESRLKSEGGELDDEAVTAVVRDIQKRGVLHTNLAPAEHDKVLTELWRLSRTAFEESGAVLLYVTLGMLEWFETPSSEAPRRAPLVLVPVLLERAGPGRWQIKRADDETRVNVTLLKKLEQDFGIDVRGTDVLPEDASGVDIPQIIHNFRQLVLSQNRWLVHEEAAIGLFSFQKFLMWLDLDAKQAALMANPVVKHLFSGSGEPYPLARELLTDREMDHTLQPDQTLHVVDADPSQVAAIHAAATGSSFVLQGPPGTGKSQTITNLISQLLAMGKSVLFVSEKRAALEVVRTRLDKVGLGPFCLELHSNQASKGAVMEQLRASFEIDRNRDSRQWQAHTEELAGVRAELNAYAGLLDEPSPFGTSTRGVLADLFGMEQTPRLVMSAAAMFQLDLARVTDHRRVAARLVDAIDEAGGLVEHPWRAVRRHDWDPAWERRVETAVRELETSARAATEARAAAANLLGLPADLPVRLLAQAAEVVRKTPTPTAELLDHNGFAARMTEVNALLERAKTLASRRESLRQCWREDLWTLDLAPLKARIDQWAQAFFLFAFFALWSVRSRLKPLVRDALPDNAKLGQHLGEALWQQGESRALTASTASRLLRQVWNGADTDASAVERLLAWAQEFHETAVGIAEVTGTFTSSRKLLALATEDAALMAAEGRAAQVLDHFVEANRAFGSAVAQVEGLLDLDIVRTWGSEPQPTQVEALAHVWAVSIPRLRNWCALASAVQEVEKRGLEMLIIGVESGRFVPSQLLDVLDRGLRETWWESRMAAAPELRGFRGTAHGMTIQRFRDLDRKAQQLAREEVFARVAERAPEANAPGDEMGLLKRQLLLQRRHMPIRKLFAQIPTTLRRLKPCVLMSPLSVAQYLDPSIQGFDVVVFDEASQIPPWDAVGAIARGKQVIVVGDSKQLPPTSFFDRGGDDEGDADPDDEALQDTESILDEMVAARVRELQLKWHYRSKHESLIAFSNWHYYENRLHTFPSAAAEVPQLGVKLRKVKGFYDRGGSRTNLAEAEAVVEELFKLLALPEGQRPSVGIVTFSQVQQRLVEDLIDKQLTRLPEMQKFFAEGYNEPVFVKNLENVQGDERDVMLFSICYGKDSAGKMTMNFGPLNRKGGERRLNVAVTRAKLRLVVFSTLEWSDIDENKSRALGVAHLKAFLRYAEHGPATLLATTSAPNRDEFGSPFEEEVHRVLTAEGWRVDTQVGCSGYRIDLGVLDPERPGTYLLGIECDGASYHGSRVARERDRLREEVLVTLGWRIHRIWSTDWWYEREKAVKRLLDAVKDAEAKARSGLPAPLADPPGPPPLLPSVKAALDSAAFAARIAAPAQSNWPADASCFRAPCFLGEAWTEADFYHPNAKRLVAQSILEIVAAFAPIHVDTLTRIIATKWGFGRTGTRIAEHILGTTSLLAQSDRPQRVGDCLWPQSMQVPLWRGFRYAAVGESRQLDEVPPEEIVNAAAWVIKRALSISQPELVREVAKVFGVKAITAKTTGIIEGLLPRLKAGARARVDGEKWLA